jgi:EAL domain-containing protein (putative c-di-GMP-specific phosphodiesterase class I)
VIAEGVEDAATFNVLRGMGCDLAQGFFISEPMADSVTETWLAESSWAASPA